MKKPKTWADLHVHVDHGTLNLARSAIIACNCLRRSAPRDTSVGPRHDGMFDGRRGGALLWPTSGVCAECSVQRGGFSVLLATSHCPFLCLDSEQSNSTVLNAHQPSSGSQAYAETRTDTPTLRVTQRRRMTMFRCQLESAGCRRGCSHSSAWSFRPLRVRVRIASLALAKSLLSC